MSNNQTVVKKEKKPLSMWAVILIVIAVVYILSFIIPAGTYERDGKMAIPGTFAIIDKVYLTPWAVIQGIGQQVYSSFGGLFITILIMGGMMGVVNSTRVIDRSLTNLIIKLRDKAVFIIPAFIFAMGFFGCMGSMISTAILFIPLGLSLAKQMKTDRTFAVGLIILGSYTGFMSSPVNTLTTILGQDIAGLTPYSGSGLRTVVTVINLAIVSAYLIWYAKNAQKHPERYEAAFADDSTSGDEAPKYEPLKANEIGVLALFFGSFIFFAVGGPAFGFNTLTLGSIMLPVGIVCGLLARYDLDTLMGNFVKGAQGMVSVLIFMILASVMSVILNNSMILDSIVYYLSIPLAHLSTAMAGIGMFIANAIINIFINSGSGQTSVVMPIMGPLADVLGVTRQMALLCLQYGDGFTNLLAPTSVNLLACLAFAKVSMKEWYKLIVPVYSILFVVLCVSIFVGTAIGYC